MWDNKRYHSIGYFLKNKFKRKVYKVSLDGGFTCPNRDGTLSSEGCIFCSDEGSGEFGGDRRKSITEQIEDQLEFLNKKIGDALVIAYFQNFTNTYGDLKYLRSIYKEALTHPRVCGLAIATRPDCIDDNIVELLKELNEETFLWVELGLQSSKEESGEIINRGWKNKILPPIMEKLNKNNIKSVAHIIYGLPGEKEEDFLNSITYIRENKFWGVKLHLMYILKGTKLEKFYNEKKLIPLTKEKYIEGVGKAIEFLDEDMVIHRLTGDGRKSDLVAPLWSCNKRDVLNSIEKHLKEFNINQGNYKV